jgi:Plasmid pRiA4b ORF-3-like protein
MHSHAKTQSHKAQLGQIRTWGELKKGKFTHVRYRFYLEKAGRDWSDFHLHRFVIRGKEYGLSRIGCTTFRTDAKKALLSQFHFRINERFLYEYDFD